MMLPERVGILRVWPAVRADRPKEASKVAVKRMLGGLIGPYQDPLRGQKIR